MGSKVFFLALVVTLIGCEVDENEHFCARYSMLFEELETEPDLPSYDEMKEQLTLTLMNPDKDPDQAKFMLFVLDDYHFEIKPKDESAREFCLRINRWQAYQ